MFAHRDLDSAAAISAMVEQQQFELERSGVGKDLVVLIKIDLLFGE